MEKAEKAESPRRPGAQPGLPDRGGLGGRVAQWVHQHRAWAPAAHVGASGGAPGSWPGLARPRLVQALGEWASGWKTSLCVYFCPLLPPLLLASGVFREREEVGKAGDEPGPGPPGGPQGAHRGPMGRAEPHLTVQGGLLLLQLHLLLPRLGAQQSLEDRPLREAALLLQGRLTVWGQGHGSGGRLPVLSAGRQRRPRTQPAWARGRRGRTPPTCHTPERTGPGRNLGYSPKASQKDSVGPSHTQTYSQTLANT